MQVQQQKLPLVCMDSLQMRRFCQHNFVEAIIDASHPYAIEVSAQASDRRCQQA